MRFQPRPRFGEEIHDFDQRHPPHFRHVTGSFPLGLANHVFASCTEPDNSLVVASKRQGSAAGMLLLLKVAPLCLDPCIFVL